MAGTDDKTDVRILAVDDDRFLRDVVSRFLKRKGYSIDTAESAGEALDMAASREYHLALLDVVMDGMDGIELAGSLRDLRPSMILIIMTGHPTLETALAALKRGVQDYLIKPFSLEQLEESIERCLRERRLVRENEHLRNRLWEAEERIHEYEELVRNTSLRHVRRPADTHAMQARGDAVYRDQSGQARKNALERSIRKLEELRIEGDITEEEYQRQRNKLFGLRGS